MKLFDLTGKTAIVTGSSRGIGRAIAETLAGAGASVVVSSRQGDACEAVATELRTGGGKAAAIACNIGDKAQLQNLAARTRESFGAIDILVCSAGINPFYGSLAAIPDSAFTQVMTSNVQSALWLAQMVREDMVARGGGAVVIVSSIAGFRHSPGLGAYGVSKAADMQLARSLAAEWGKDGIRVNCIAPGLIKTDFARALWENEELLRRRLATTPLGRIGDPEDIAGAALLLASEAGRFITGQTIVIDGGATVVG